MNNTVKFWDKHAQGYSKRPVSDEVSYQKKLEITRSYLKPDFQVLEIGCGTGTTALCHAKHVAHIHGTDLSPNMIEIAREKAKSQGVSNASFEAIAIDDLDIEPASQDMIMAHSILHLLDNKDEVIERIHSWLKPGGVFISSTVCLGDSAFKVFKYIGPIGRALGILPLISVFKRNALEDVIQKTGFSIEESWQPTNGHGVFIAAVK